MENTAHIFCNPEEEYWTIPPILSFLKDNQVKIDNINVNKGNNKAKLVSAALDFAKANKANEQIFAEWVDKTVKEGIKEIVLYKCRIDNGISLILSNEEGIQKHLDKYVDKESTGYLINSQYDNQTKLIKYTSSTMRGKRVLTLYFCRMVTYIEKRNLNARNIEFPVIFDFFIDDGWYVVRYKSRSNLYEYNQESQSVYATMEQSLNAEKPVRDAVDYAKRILGITDVDDKEQAYNLKKKFYKLLKSFTETPPEIQTELDQYQTFITDIEQKIKELCGIPENQISGLHCDIRNLFEKYISINRQDKEIFTRKRNAYPVKLCATDEEDSHVDQAAGGDAGPLQSKAIFFDNKRMIDNDKTCDGLTLKWRRNTRTYYTETFTVRISEKKGKCNLSFKEYTAEEDIQDVLFSIIDA